MGSDSSVIEDQPRPDWQVLPRPGCRNVEFRVVLMKEHLAIANLRFTSDATIDKHDAPFDIDVVCIAGSGFASIGDETYPLRHGQSIRWPQGRKHCLWTDGDTMETLMIERHSTSKTAEHDP